MPRISILQTFTVLILFSACLFVANRVAKYILKADGGYGQWSVFTDCSKSCGGGIRMRQRKCNNPIPRHGGQNCSVLGARMQVFACNRDACPVNGGYGEWSDYEICSRSCGGGVQVRRRKCDNPAPQYRGKNCKELELGPDQETKECNEQKCPVHGGYSIWSDFGTCSKSCGGGVKSRGRTCTNPVPSEGGKDCSELGPEEETTSCNTDPCPTTQSPTTTQPPTTTQLPTTQPPTEPPTEPTTKPIVKPNTPLPETPKPTTREEAKQQPPTSSGPDKTPKATEMSPITKVEQVTAKPSEKEQPTEKPK